MTVRLCAWLSNCMPVHIICCSEASRGIHEALGYDICKMSVIGNGVDFTAFSPDRTAGAKIRSVAGLQPDVPLIGMVARFHPQKDHQNFIRAAAILSDSHPNVQFLLCGEGVEPSNITLSNWISDEGIGARVHLLGERSDIKAVHNSLNIATLSSSYGEGFPNVLAEAMACGVPCVATDIGDSAIIVGEGGSVVPPSNPVALAAAWAEILEGDVDFRTALGTAARHRVLQNFRLEDVVDRYQKLYEDVLQ